MSHTDPSQLTSATLHAPHPTPQHLIFDATPTVACLDFCAERVARMNPDAKLVFMLRDPVSAAFSAEIMVSRGAGGWAGRTSCW